MINNENNIIKKKQIELIVREWVLNAISEQSIPAIDMEDALTKVLVDVKNLVLQDIYTELQNNQQNDDGSAIIE